MEITNKYNSFRLSDEYAKANNNFLGWENFSLGWKWFKNNLSLAAIPTGTGIFSYFLIYATANTPVFYLMVGLTCILGIIVQVYMYDQYSKSLVFTPETPKLAPKHYGKAIGLVIIGVAVGIILQIPNSTTKSPMESFHHVFLVWFLWAIQSWISFLLMRTAILKEDPFSDLWENFVRAFAFTIRLAISALLLYFLYLLPMVVITIAVAVSGALPSFSIERGLDGLIGLTGWQYAIIGALGLFGLGTVLMLLKLVVSSYFGQVPFFIDTFKNRQSPR